MALSNIILNVLLLLLQHEDYHKFKEYPETSERGMIQGLGEMVNSELVGLYLGKQKSLWGWGRLCSKSQAANRADQKSQTSSQLATRGQLLAL
jgi:hypothetical protein